jgi:hypothetical protein
VRVLFLTEKHLDYVADPLYIGLSRVLGDEQVVDYPYKPAFHDPESRPWYLVQRPGRRFSREEILDRLRDRYFDLVCLSSFRQDCLDECAELYARVPFPPLVFVDGGDYADMRHDVLGRYPIRLYFKRDYVWKKGNPLREFWDVLWTFRGDRRLFARTVPLPLSIVVDGLPAFGPVSKEMDVSYRGRASHPRRVKACTVLSRMKGIQFSGGVYASPDDRQYKLKAGRLERWQTKLFQNAQASEADQLKKMAPEPYYREIAASRIAVALRGGGWTAPPRYYEIVAMRTMLLSDEPEAVIPNEFENRRHAVYCKADLSNLEDLVRYYLREEAERETIVNDGYAHLLKYHTCERRAEYFLEICQRAL